MPRTITFTEAQLLDRNRKALSRCGLTEQQLQAKLRGSDPLTNSEWAAVEIHAEAAFLLTGSSARWRY